MTRSEFISKLRGGLFGTLSQDRIDDEISYYENYIDGQVASGKSEQQVLDELGDPMLISRTIIAAADYSNETIDDGFGRETYREAYTDSSRGQKSSKRTYTASYTDADGNTRYETGSGFLGLMKMLHKTRLLYVILVLLLVIVAVVAVVGGLIYVLLPVLPILIVVWVLWKMMRGR